MANEENMAAVNGGDVTVSWVIRRMCEDTELLSIILLSARRQYVRRWRSSWKQHILISSEISSSLPVLHWSCSKWQTWFGTPWSVFFFVCLFFVCHMVLLQIYFDNVAMSPGLSSYCVEETMAKAPKLFKRQKIHPAINQTCPFKNSSIKSVMSQLRSLIFELMLFVRTVKLLTITITVPLYSKHI